MSPSDDELLHGMMAGDEEAFVSLYRRHQGALYRFALQMSGSESIAEEVTQEVFLALIRDVRQYDSCRGTLSAYLYGIARNQVLRCLEKDRSYVPIADEVEGAMPALTSREDLLGELTERQRLESVRRAILALPPNYREAVVLCDVHEMSYAEAAAVLGCALGTVRSRLHRGRALLCEKLRPRRRAEDQARSGCCV